MNIAKGLMETTSSCLYRVKNIMVYMNHFKGSLTRLADTDKSVQSLIREIFEQSNKLAELLEKLAFKLDKAPLDRAEMEEFEAGANRRRSERLKVEAEGTFIFSNADKKTYQLQDLSATGMKIIGDKPINTGDSADIVVSSPFLRNTIHKNAKVVWNKKVDDNLWIGGVELVNS